MNNKIINFGFWLAVLTQQVLAIGGLDKAEEIATDLQTGLHTMAAVVVAIAFMFVGFKMIFQGARFTDVAIVFIGGIVIGSAIELAAFIVG